MALTGPGTWLIFGVIGLPVYTLLLGWFLGKPKDKTATLLGLGYLIGVTSFLWINLLVISLLIGVVFYQSPF
jgi:hypothetical protein